MNKKIDLTKLGGFPLTQQTLAFMQNSYVDALGALAHFVGGQTILSGLTISGNTATDGWIITHGGEIIPFIGGTVSPFYIIETITEEVTFFDNETKGVYQTKRARFGGVMYLFSQLKRVGKVSELWQRGDTKDIIITADQFALDFDGQGIGRNGRLGWALCDGQDGRPDVRGRVFVNYDPNQTEFNMIGKIGGVKDVTLTVGQIPPHTHGYQAPLLSGDHPGRSSGYNRPNMPNAGTTSSAGGGQAHTNLQPYFVAVKIIKI